MWFQNCNGLVKKGDINEFQFDMANMADEGINYFSFSETCVNTSKFGFSSKISDAFKQVIPSGGFSLNNTSEYPRHTNYQPGGVAAGFDAMLRMKFLCEGRDDMGRWIWQEFGQNERILQIYTIYRVNNGTEYASGENTASSQQKRNLIKKNIKGNPRKHVMEMLTKELAGLIEKGVNVIVGGDFNERIHSPEKMSQMMEKLGLFNVFEQRLDSRDLPRTHSRGSLAVDHIWATPLVLDHIVHAGMAPFGGMCESDHRGLYIDLDEKMLFQPDDVKIVYHDFRRLKSNMPKRVKRYMRLLMSEWKSQQIDLDHLKLMELCATSAPIEAIQDAANKLDKKNSNDNGKSGIKMY